MASSIPAELTEAKLLLRHGVFHISHGRPSRLDRRLGVHHAHHAVELALRKKTDELHAIPTQVYEFPKLLKYLRDNGVTVAYQRELDELNRTRELIQHFGQVPDEKEAYRLVQAAENFMKDYCTAVFGVDYDKLSPIDLISNKDIRKTLAEAQEAYDNRKFGDAAVTAELAIQQGKWVVEQKVMRRGYMHSLSIDNQRLLSDVAETIQDIETQLDNVLDVALTAQFASKLKRLHDITCAGFMKTGGGVNIQVWKQVRDHEPTQDDADFALELAIEYLQWADQAYGLEVESKADKSVP